MTTDETPVAQDADPGWAEQVTTAVLTIAEDVFTAMVDGEPGHLAPADPASVQDPLDPSYAWVDTEGTTAARVLLVTARRTAEDLARALLQMAPDEPVGTSDVADAFGEVANVVGGNLKSLSPDAGALSMPVVSAERPSPAGGRLLLGVPLTWRGELVSVELWGLR